MSLITTKQARDIEMLLAQYLTHSGASIHLRILFRKTSFIRVLPKTIHSRIVWLMDSAKQILDDISANYGFSDSEIARRVKTTQPTIFRIRNGADCYSSLYIAICRLRDSLKRQKKLAA